MLTGWTSWRKVQCLNMDSIIFLFNHFKEFCVTCTCYFTMSLEQWNPFISRYCVVHVWNLHVSFHVFASPCLVPVLLCNVLEFSMKLGT
jgi:hypothetical protein